MVPLLLAGGQEVVAASPATGVDTIAGDGLHEVLSGAEVVVDVSDAPSFEAAAVLDFLTTSARNLIAAATAARVPHQVVLSVVGTDRLPDNTYLQAKLAQEQLIATSGLPYTILRSTQFFEYLGPIAESALDGDTVRLPTCLMHIAADEAAEFTADAALGTPRNGIAEIAGPEPLPIADIVGRFLGALDDPREVLSDPAALYFGGRVEERSLVPLGEARLGRITFEDWLPRWRAALATGSAPSTSPSTSTELGRNELEVSEEP
jgi:uncharacterized protein YbjT (DUF2867 family)